MKLQNELGEIRISSDVFTAITGSAATNCYGVKGMAVRSKTDGLVHLLKRESMAKGVKVYYNEDGTVSIELHIIDGLFLRADGSGSMNHHSLESRRVNIVYHSGYFPFYEWLKAHGIHTHIHRGDLYSRGLADHIADLAHNGAADSHQVDPCLLYTSRCV